MRGLGIILWGMFLTLLMTNNITITCILWGGVFLFGISYGIYLRIKNK